MNCEEVKKVIDTWEESGNIKPKEYQSLLSHVEKCDNCASQYNELLPLIRHDAGEKSINLRAKEPDWTKLENRIMGNLPDNARKYENSRQKILFLNRSTIKRILLPVAAMLILGISLFSILYRVGTPNDEVTVRFVLTAPEANTVSLVGDFNNWKPTKLVLKDRKDGRWEITVKLKKGKVYTYNFLINGKQWIIDPNSYAIVDDGFGGKSSLLKL